MYKGWLYHPSVSEYTRPTGMVWESQLEIVMPSWMIFYPLVSYPTESTQWPQKCVLMSSACGMSGLSRLLEAHWVNAEVRSWRLLASQPVIPISAWGSCWILCSMMVVKWPWMGAWAWSACAWRMQASMRQPQRDWHGMWSLRWWLISGLVFLHWSSREAMWMSTVVNMSCSCFEGCTRCTLTEPTKVKQQIWMISKKSIGFQATFCQLIGLYVAICHEVFWWLKSSNDGRDRSLCDESCKGKAFGWRRLESYFGGTCSSQQTLAHSMAPCSLKTAYVHSLTANEVKRSLSNKDLLPRVVEANDLMLEVRMLLKNVDEKHLLSHDCSKAIGLFEVQLVQFVLGIKVPEGKDYKSTDAIANDVVKVLCHFTGATVPNRWSAEDVSPHLAASVSCSKTCWHMICFWAHGMDMSSSCGP